jgi:hypothetical protein
MRRASLSLLFFALFAAVLSSGASAAVYTVTLANGTTFDTRYQPEYASWDPEKVILLTEFGNQIAFPASEIQSVTVDSETKGFGYQIDTTTMALGWAPNDQLDPYSDEGKAALAQQAANAQAQAAMPQNYTQQQFVDPSQLTGQPLWMTGINAVPQLGPPPVLPPVLVPTPGPVTPPN